MGARSLRMHLVLMALGVYYTRSHASGNGDSKMTPVSSSTAAPIVPLFNLTAEGVGTLARSQNTTVAQLFEDPLEAFISQQTRTRATLLASVGDVLGLWTTRVTAADALAMEAKARSEAASKELDAARGGMQDSLERAKRYAAEAASAHRSSLEQLLGVGNPAAFAPSVSASGTMTPASSVALPVQQPNTTQVGETGVNATVAETSMAPVSAAAAAASPSAPATTSPSTSPSATAAGAIVPPSDLQGLLNAVTEQTKRVDTLKALLAPLEGKAQAAKDAAAHAAEESKSLRYQAITSIGKAVEAARGRLDTSTKMLADTQAEFTRQLELAKKASVDAQAAQAQGRPKEEAAAALASATHQTDATKALSKLSTARSKHVAFLSSLLEYLQNIYNAWGRRIVDPRPFTDDTLPQVSNATQSAASDASNDKSRVDTAFLKSIESLYGKNTALGKLLEDVESAQSKAQAAVNAANAARESFDKLLKGKLAQNDTAPVFNACDPNSAWYDDDDCCCGNSDPKRLRRQQANFDIDAADVVGSSKAVVLPPPPHTPGANGQGSISNHAGLTGAASPGVPGDGQAPPNGVTQTSSYSASGSGSASGAGGNAGAPQEVTTLPLADDVSTGPAAQAAPPSQPTTGGSSGGTTSTTGAALEPATTSPSPAVIPSPAAPIKNPQVIAAAKSADDALLVAKQAVEAAQVGAASGAQLLRFKSVSGERARLNRALIQARADLERNADARVAVNSLAHSAVTDWLTTGFSLSAASRAQVSAADLIHLLPATGSHAGNSEPRFASQTSGDDELAGQESMAGIFSAAQSIAQMSHFGGAGASHADTGSASTVEHAASRSGIHVVHPAITNNQPAHSHETASEHGVETATAARVSLQLAPHNDEVQPPVHLAVRLASESEDRVAVRPSHVPSVAGAGTRFVAGAVAAHDTLALKAILDAVSAAASEALEGAPAPADGITATANTGNVGVAAEIPPAAAVAPTLGSASVVPASTPSPTVAATLCPCPSGSHPAVVAAGSSPLPSPSNLAEWCPCPLPPAATSATVNSGVGMTAASNGNGIGATQLVADCNAAGSKVGGATGPDALSQELSRALCESLGKELAALVRQALASPAASPTTIAAPAAVLLQVEERVAMLPHSKDQTPGIWSAHAAIYRQQLSGLLHQAEQSTHRSPSNAGTSDTTVGTAPVRFASASAMGGDEPTSNVTPAAQPGTEAPASVLETHGASTLPASANMPPQAAQDALSNATTLAPAEPPSAAAIGATVLPTVVQTSSGPQSSDDRVAANRSANGTNTTGSTPPLPSATPTTAASSTIPITPSASHVPAVAVSPFPSIAHPVAASPAPSSLVVVQDVHVVPQGDGKLGLVDITVIRHGPESALQRLDALPQPPPAPTTQEIGQGTSGSGGIGAQSQVTIHTGETGAGAGMSIVVGRGNAGAADGVTVRTAGGRHLRSGSAA